MPRGSKNWSPIPEEQQAEAFTTAVRQAFVDVYGPPDKLGVVEESIRSSFLEDGKKLGWTKPDPNVVIVLTEYAWVPDPFTSKKDYEAWGKVADLLRQRGWPKAWVDSINSGVQVVYWVR